MFAYVRLARVLLIHSPICQMAQKLIQSMHNAPMKTAPYSLSTFRLCVFVDMLDHVKVLAFNALGKQYTLAEGHRFGRIFHWTFI